MDEKIAAGTWVEIGSIVLRPGDRAQQLPKSTAGVPLEMRVKGFLVSAAALGGKAEVETPAGRRLRGDLLTVNPPHGHSFGPPVPELSTIGDELRAILRKVDDPL